MSASQSASASASLGCWMKSVLITSLIVTCLLATITDSIRQNVCLRADIPALTTVQCPLNHQIQIHNAYAGVQNNLNCSDNRVAAEGCTHSHSDKTEAFRSACNSVIERCYVNVTYSEPDRYCLDEVPLGQPYINIQYQCRPVMDPFGHQAIVIDPMLVDTVSYSHIPKLTLQSVNYPTMSSSFGNTTCRFMLASSNTLRIDTYEMTYQGNSVEPPYCIMFGDREECAEVAGVFQVMEPSGDTNVTITIRDSAAISGRFWIDLAALFTSDRTYTYMDVECSGDLMTGISSSSSTPSTTRRGVTPSATVPSLPPSITTSSAASTTSVLSATPTAHVTTLPTSTTLNASASTTSSTTTSMSVTTQANTTPSSHSTTSPTPTSATGKSQPFITSSTRVSTTAPPTQSMIGTPAMSQSFTTPTPSTSGLPSITPTTSTSSTSASTSPSPSPSHASPSYTSPTKTASVTTAGRITVASTPSSTSTSTILTTLQSTSTSTFSTMSPVISSRSTIHTTGSMASTSSSSTTKPTTSTLSSSTASMPSVSTTVTTTTLSSTAKLVFSTKPSTGSTRSSKAWSTPSRPTVSLSSSSAFTTITTITDSNSGETVRLNKKESPVSKGLIIGLVVAIVAVTVIGAILIKFASKKRTKKDDERILVAHDENNIEQNGGPHLVYHATDETIGQGIATENFNTTVC